MIKSKSMCDSELYSPFSSPTSQNALNELISNNILNGTFPFLIEKHKSQGSDPHSYSVVEVVMSFAIEHDLSPNVEQLSAENKSYVDLLGYLERAGLSFIDRNAAIKTVYIHAVRVAKDKLNTIQDTFALTLGQGRIWGVGANCESKHRDHIAMCLKESGFSDIEIKDVMANIRAI